MAMIKTLARKQRGCKDIKSYLERGGRSLALDTSDAVMDVENWDTWMDQTRALYGKDEGRRYYHFVISPDPKDGIGIDSLRDMATAWARERYPEGEWAIEYHDDNGIPHAHVVLNSVLPSTGGKVHMSAKDVREDALALQRIGAELGCSVMDGFEVVRGDDGEWIARSDWAKTRRRDRARERRARSSAQQEWMRRNGMRLWKDDMRAAIEEAIEESRTWRGFNRALAARGYEAREGRRGQITFYPPEGNGFPTKGYKLDDSYTRDGIRARLAPRIGRPHGGTLTAPEPSIAIPRSLAENLSSALRRGGMRNVSERRVAAAIAAINIVRANRFTSISQMKQATEKLYAQAAELDERIEEATNAYSQLDEATRKLVEIRACRERMAPRPNGRRALKRWETANAAEIAIIDDNEAWLEARGIDADATREDLRARAAELYGEAQRISDEADRIKGAAQRFSDAVAALAGVPCPAFARNDDARAAREARASARRPEVRVFNAEQTRRAFEAHIRMSAQLRREFIAGSLDAQRIRYLQRLQEEQIEAIAAERDDERTQSRRQSTEAQCSEAERCAAQDTSRRMRT